MGFLTIQQLQDQKKKKKSLDVSDLVGKRKSPRGSGAEQPWETGAHAVMITRQRENEVWKTE